MKKPLLTALLFLLTIPFFIFPASAADEEPVEHSLNIQYLNEDGSQAFPTYSAQLMEGEEYSVPSPASEEASPNPETVSGIMGDEDVSEIVTYASERYRLTIDYVYLDDYSLKLAPSYVGYFRVGEEYNVPSPVIQGYTPHFVGGEVVTGTMSAAGAYHRVVYRDSFHWLIVNYCFLDGKTAAYIFQDRFKYGSTYSIPSPSVKGYTPDTLVLSGTVTAAPNENITKTIYYYPIDCNLTIKYQYEDGSEAFPFYKETIKYDASYSVESPLMDGYEPDIPLVSGKINSENLEIIVTYKKNNPILTIDYLFPDGSPAAESVSEAFAPGEEYRINSPTVRGHVPDIPIVTGTMPEEDFSVTVRYSLKVSKLVIDYRYEDGRKAANTVTRSLEYNQPYDIPSPAVSGHVPDKPTVSGKMWEGDIHVTVTYSQPPHTLTIRYQYKDGTEAAPPYTASVKYNDYFSVPSPAVPGFTPERSVVSGKMGDADATFTVVYKPTKYLLTIKYNRQSGKTRANGTKIAPDYTGRYEEGEKYEVPSPSVMGYQTEAMTVTGIMPAHDVIETVSYSLAGEPVMGDMSGLLDVVSSSGEYMREYLSKMLLTLVTAGLVMFAGFIVIRVILYIIRRFTRI